MDLNFWTVHFLTIKDRKFFLKENVNIYYIEVGPLIVVSKKPMEVVVGSLHGTCHVNVFQER